MRVIAEDWKTTGESAFRSADVVDGGMKVRPSALIVFEEITVFRVFMSLTPKLKGCFSIIGFLRFEIWKVYWRTLGVIILIVSSLVAVIVQSLGCRFEESVQETKSVVTNLNSLGKVTITFFTFERSSAVWSL